MTIETRETKIDGRTYSLPLLPADKGIKVSGRIAKYFVGPIATVLAAEAFEKLDGTLILAAILQLTGYLAEDDFVEQVKVLTAELKCDGKPVHFNDHWAGNYGALARLVLFALRENFGSFFAGSLGPLLEKIGPLVIQKLQSTLSSQPLSQAA